MLTLYLMMTVGSKVRTVPQLAELSISLLIVLRWRRKYWKPSGPIWNHCANKSWLGSKAENGSFRYDAVSEEGLSNHNRTKYGKSKSDWRRTDIGLPTPSSLSSEHPLANYQLGVYGESLPWGSDDEGNDLVMETPQLLSLTSLCRYLYYQRWIWL
jgi:hypothetical protein